MKKTKILKREDKSRVKISVSLSLDYFGVFWNTTIQICPPKKRKFHTINLSDNYTWRRLSMDERTTATYAEQLKHVSEEEILAVKLELWNQLKPTT